MVKFNLLTSLAFVFIGLNVSCQKYYQQVDVSNYVHGLEMKVDSLQNIVNSHDPTICDSIRYNDTCYTPKPIAAFFASDFEDAYLSTDKRVILGSTWEKFVSNPIIGSFQTITEGYNTASAHPEIVDFDGSNALHFKILNPVGEKARVQSSLSFNVDTIKEYRSVYRFFLHPDLKYLENYSGGTEYLKLFEIWEEHVDEWDGNSAGQAYWRFGLKTNSLCWFYDGYTEQPASVRSKLIFPRVLSNIPIPYGKWATLDYTFTPGAPGRVYITLEVDGEKSVLFDLKVNTTYPGHSRPVAWYQPFKFYMPAELVNYMNAGGKELSIWYDDYKLYLK